MAIARKRQVSLVDTTNKLGDTHPNYYEKS